jgi:acyl carrier protein
MSLVRDRSLRVIAAILRVPVAGLDESSSPDSIDTWDSLRHLQVLLALEEEFGMQFPADASEQLQTVGALLAAVEDQAR